MDDVGGGVFDEQAEERRDAAEGESEEDNSRHEQDKVAATHIWIEKTGAEEGFEGPVSRLDHICGQKTCKVPAMSRAGTQENGTSMITTPR